MWIPRVALDERPGGHFRGDRISTSFSRNTRAIRTSKPSKPYTTSPEPPVGRLLHSLSKFDFDQDAKHYEASAAITDCKTVASYNWLDRREATIIVPGKPPRWTPPSQARQLRPDGGEYFRDRNAANFPTHPIEPAVVAALTMDPGAAREVDIVACSSTLGNLLRFIGEEDKRFRVLVELVGNTVFFVRRENTPRELIPEVRGYGHSFPEAYTTWDPEVKGSTSHQRVLSYRFGGLRCLVRFESDGYIADKAGQATGNLPDRTSPAALGTAETAEDLLAAFSGGRVTHHPPTDYKAGLKVIRAGCLIKNDGIFELKTRSTRRKEADFSEDTFGNQLPRLWVSQVPNFILAYHTWGFFEENDITIKDAQEEVSAWESEHVGVLSHLAALMHHVIAMVRGRPDSKLELRHDAVGILEIREQLPGAGDALSQQVRTSWVNDGENALHNTSGFGASGSDLIDFETDRPAEDDWDDDKFEPDFTACSADGCGYCGRCPY